MTRVLLLVALFFSLSTIKLQAQNVTEKWNSTFNRYEYYDSKGQLIGYKKKNMFGQWEYFDKQQSTQDTPQRDYSHLDRSPYNLELIEKALHLRQQQYERQLEQERLNEVERLRLKKEKAQNMMEQINTYYNAAESYPQTIKDGWHNVYATNRYDFCDIRKVYVENNKITKYVIDDWFYRPIVSTLPIKNGIASITINKNDLLTIVFLEYIYEPNKTIQPPLKSGTVSFWHNKKGGGPTDVWVDGRYIGEINSYFKKGEPNCGQDGTLTYEYKPGTYRYEAENNRNIWSGTITIRSGQCSQIRLNK